jgi:hypothetical protein
VKVKEAVIFAEKLVAPKQEMGAVTGYCQTEMAFLEGPHQ